MRPEGGMPLRIRLSDMLSITSPFVWLDYALRR